MVERLCVEYDIVGLGNVRDFATFLPGTLPMLREFEGPAQLARQFLARSPLERLTLSFDQDNDLDEILSGAPPAQNVLALHLSISAVNINIACVDPVLRLFPNITEFAAEIFPNENPKKTRHSQTWKTVRGIAAMGPTSLVSLSLTLVEVVELFESEEYSDHEEESSDSDGSDDFDVFSSTAYCTAIIAEVRARCLDLKDVWIETDLQIPREFFAVHWRQHPNGRVSQEVATDEASVERMRRMKEST
ncbi:hypothetical protein C8F01DRAFT_1174473 [Mycena amicta]|nr:hypothetical protein C8F01DRAFT_1174473 [Mycena amicta]